MQLLRVGAPLCGFGVVSAGAVWGGERLRQQGGVARRREKSRKVTGKGFSFECGNKKVKVDVPPPEARNTGSGLCLRRGYCDVGSCSRGTKRFEVEFKKDYPF